MAAALCLPDGDWIFPTYRDTVAVLARGVDLQDGVNSLAVLDLAVKLAREGSGPLLVEADTHRMQARTNADDDTRCRESAEVAEWRARTR